MNLRDDDLRVPDYSRRPGLRERKFSPGLFRDPGLHAPEEGLGGSNFWVTYHSMDNIGVVYSTWDAAAGVHWRVVLKSGHHLAELVEGRKVRRAFPNLGAALNALLLDVNVEPTYPHSTNRTY